MSFDSTQKVAFKIPSPTPPNFRFHQPRFQGQPNRNLVVRNSGESPRISHLPVCQNSEFWTPWMTGVFLPVFLTVVTGDGKKSCDFKLLDIYFWGKDWREWSFFSQKKMNCFNFFVLYCFVILSWSSDHTCKCVKAKRTVSFLHAGSS